MTRNASTGPSYECLPCAVKESQAIRAVWQRLKFEHAGCDEFAQVTLRVAGKLRHIGVGRTHTGTHVILLVQELDVTIINASTGEILRQLTIDLNRDYQPHGTKK